MGQFLPSQSLFKGYQNDEKIQKSVSKGQGCFQKIAKVRKDFPKIEEFFWKSKKFCEKSL